jgi:hypothetical protein
MLNKHLVVTPENRKGSRQANIRKAIKESYWWRSILLLATRFIVAFVATLALVL